MLNAKKRMFLASILSTIGFVSVFIGLVINDQSSSILNWMLLIVIGVCSIIQWVSFRIEVKK